MKTSIKVKKFWFSDVATDGGVGTNWKEIQVGLREATVQFNGSDADTTNYKNVLGSILESSMSKGDKTMNLQIADLTPAIIAEFTGGVVTSSVDSDKYEAPENENQAIEKSIRFLSDKNVLYTIPRVSFDGYPIMNDDDLHYYQMNGVVLKPEKAGLGSYSYDILKLVDANNIVSFSIPLQTGSSTINTSAHTVAVTMPALTVVTALVPTIGVSLGASVSPESGEPENFTAPVVYTVEAANGDTQNWTVTVTVTP
jgi:hypothetical protein